MMDPRYFKEFSDWLRHTRESVSVTSGDISEKTRLSHDTIGRMENSDFNFAPPLFIQGYLRLYAETIGLDADTVVKEFKTIVNKIHYVTSDHAVASVTGQESSEHPVDPLLREVIEFWASEDELTRRSELDRAVRRKLIGERIVNYSIFAGGAVLASLCVLFLWTDSKPVDVQTTATIAKYEKRTEVYQPKRLEPRKRLAFFLSEPLRTEEERRALDSMAMRDREAVDRARENRISHRALAGRIVEAISVQEAARSLEKSLIHQ